MREFSLLVKYDPRNHDSLELSLNRPTAREASGVKLNRRRADLSRGTGTSLAGLEL